MKAINNMRVKPLVWDEYLVSNGTRKIAQAVAPYTSYSITQKFFPETHFAVSDTYGDHVSNCATFNEAKEAAQADYERRIMAMLEPVDDVGSYDAAIDCATKGEWALDAEAKLKKAFEIITDQTEESLWDAYGKGYCNETDTWTHMCMSDGEWLVRALGLDVKQMKYSGSEIREAIPKMAQIMAHTDINEIAGCKDE